MDPKTLEREADTRRANLNQTLDAMEQRFSPNHLVQQTVDYFGVHGGDIAQSVGRSVKSNPMPLILTGIGLAWLISTQSRSSSPYDNNGSYRDLSSRWDEGGYGGSARRNAYTQNTMSAAGSRYGSDSDDDSMMDNAKEAAEQFAQTVSQWKNELQSKLQSVKQEAGETVDQWRERVVNTSVEQADGIDQQYRQLTRSASNWRNDLQLKLMSVKQEAGESAEQWRDRVASTSAEQADNLEYQYRQARQQMMAQGRQQVRATKNWMQEQPLVAGALGIAAGALIGALLPSSRVEDELVGDRADSLKSSLARQAESVGDDVASQVADSAQTIRAKGEEQLEQVKSKGSTSQPA